MWHPSLKTWLCFQKKESCKITVNIYTAKISYQAVSRSMHNLIKKKMMDIFTLLSNSKGLVLDTSV